MEKEINDQFRPAKYDEFIPLMQKAIKHEYDEYRKHVPQYRVQEMVDNEPDELWNFEGRESFVTEDGKSIIVTVPNGDGSTYLYSVYVDAEQRNKGIGTALINFALKRYKKGISLHVHNKDINAHRLYNRLGFKPYGMGNCNTVFMATKKGLGGKFEWGND